MALLGHPGNFLWRRLQAYEVAHAELMPIESERWELSSERNKIIANSVVIALAGGAAERCEAGQVIGPIGGLARIQSWTGSVDLQLAHEWLTLQRYDGDQTAIEADLERLFDQTCAMLAEPLRRQVLGKIQERIIAALNEADRLGLSELRTPAQRFCDGLSLGLPPVFELKATLNHPSSPNVGAIP